MAVTEAQYKAKEKYEKNRYDRVTVRLPKGTRQQILDHGETVSGFIVRAVLEKLEG